MLSVRLITLEEVFEQASGLAGQLRQQARRLHQKQGLSDAGRVLLLALESSGELTVPQLARLRSSTRQNVRMLVNRLEADGWVEFIANPDHKSSGLVRLTESGRRMLRSANQRQAAMLPPLLPHFTEEELRLCAGLLSRIRKLLGGRTPANHEIRKRHGKARSRRPRRDHKTDSEPQPSALAPEAEPRFAEPEELPVSLL